MPTVLVLEGNIREENPPHWPTPRRVALESVRQIIQAIQAIVWQVLKYAWCISPVNLHKSTKYSRNTLRIMTRSVPTRKPAPEATKMVARTSSSTVRRKRWTPWYPMMNLSQGKIRGKSDKKTKSDPSEADPSEDVRTYCINRLNLVEPVNDSKINSESESASEWLLVQHRECHMSNK